LRGSIEDTAEDTTAINEYDYAATIDTEILQIFSLQLLKQRSCRYSSIILFPNVIYLLPRLD
jgi:hypothetical protein